MENDDMNIFEQTAEDVKEYAGLQLNRFKLRLLENSSTLLNALFGTVLTIVLGSFALIFLAVAATWGLGLLLGDFLIAILIMACIFIIATVIVFMRRKKLIVNQVIRMLGRMMFETDKEDEDE